MLKLIANVRTVFKKDESTKVKNYRSVSLLNLFSKTNEIYIWESDPFLIFFSEFISALIAQIIY